MFNSHWVKDMSTSRKKIVDHQLMITFLCCEHQKGCEAKCQVKMNLYTRKASLFKSQSAHSHHSGSSNSVQNSSISSKTKPSCAEGSKQKEHIHIADFSNASNTSRTIAPDKKDQRVHESRRFRYSYEKVN